MKKNILLYAFAGLLTACSVANNKINVADFGASAGDGIDDTQAILDAVAACKKITNPVLVFAKGEYDISTDKSRATWQRIVTAAIEGKESWAGAPPKGLEGWPADKNTIIYLANFNQLTIEGNDAVLLIDGMAQPLAAYNCTKLLIRNLQIDYKHHPAITGKIIECGESFIEVQITDGTNVDSGIPFIALQQYDAQSKLPTSIETFAGVKNTEILPNGNLRLNMTSDERGKGFPQRLTKGNLLVMRTVLGGYEPIEIKEGKDVILKNVKLYSGIGMGILGVGVENLLLDSVQIVPRPGSGRLMSITADGTHFIGCRGTIELRNCVIEGEGDDHLNIHGQYQFVEKITDRKSITSRIGTNSGFGHWNESWVYGWTSLPRVGETVEFCQKYNLNIKGTARIASVEHNSKDGRCNITFETEIPSEVSAEDIFYTQEQTPKLRVNGCRLSYGRSRGLLISTRDAVVENNAFINNGGTSIFVCAEIDWLVVPAPADILIRNNTFTNCGYAVANEGGVITIDFKKHTTVEGMNRNICIENNRFDQAHGYAIWAKQCQDLLIVRNKFTNCPQAIWVEQSEGVKVEQNEIDDKSKVIIK